jgi:phytanoyl-CoA hydroxylase
MLLPRSAEINLEAPLASFSKNGYARLGRVLAPEGAKRLCERANALMLGEIRVPGLFFQHDSASGRYEDLHFGAGWVGPSLSYRKLEKLELDPLFAAWIENPLFGRIAHAVLGEEVSLYRAVLWNKASRAGMELPWHQDDGAFWGIDRSPCLQIWTALDDAPIEAGCVEVVPGSHLGGLATQLGGTVPAKRLEEARAEARSLPVPVAQGESLLIHNHVWHRSGRNATATPRRAIGISYLSGATRCKRTKRAPREFRRVFGCEANIHP